MNDIPRIMSKDIEQAVDVDFTENEEGWNIYKLEDGTILKVKLVLQGIKRLKKYRRDGNPIYLLQTERVTRTINVPKELKGKAKVSAYQAV